MPRFVRHRHVRLIEKFMKNLKNGALIWQGINNGWIWATNRLWLFLPWLAIPVLWPFYAEGLPRSNDGGLHLLRVAVLDFHLRHDTLYPRWVPEMLVGYGYPVFGSYAPATYYLVELFHLLGLSYYHAFISAFVLLILAAGLGMYWLAIDVFGREHKWAALVAATAYLYAPYLLNNMLIRGAMAETAAQALLPWIFWGIRRLLRSEQPQRYYLPVALSLGALAITHNITLLFSPLLLSGFILIHWWQGGHKALNTRWALFAFLTAMGISAFFWLPLILERGNIADTGYAIAKNSWLPRNVWTWQNFLDWHFFFNYTFIRPVQLGLVQLLLGLLGFALVRRRDAEWWLFLIGTILIGCLIGKWALPIWLNSNILLIAQFPWRLLSHMSLAIALFTGSPVLRLRKGWPQVVVALLLIGVVIVAQRPILNWIDVYSTTGTDVKLPVLTQLELGKGAITGGDDASTIQEFRPRWADSKLQLDPSPDLTAPKMKLAIQQANAYELALTVTNTQSAPLRFNNLYFPGWQVLLDDQTALTTYPTTNLGLLTVDLPAGAHQLHLRWTGTSIQHAAGAIGLLTLLIASIVYWRQRTWRWLSLIPLALLSFGVAATVWSGPLLPVQAPTKTVKANGVQMLGYRWARSDPGHLWVYPYWYIAELPSANLRARWELQDATGKVQAEIIAKPYFNAVPANNWPPGTLVDDVYQLPLPPGLAAGTYQMAVRLGENVATLKKPAIPIGQVTLVDPAPVLAQPPEHALAIHFGDAIRLNGYNVTRQGQAFSAAEPKPALVYNHDYLEYTLFWRATAPINQNYHGVMHLLDLAGHAIAQEDHVPGPMFHPPALWDAYYLQPDTYLLRVPKTAPSGLYWPSVRMYDADSQALLPVHDNAAQDLGDHFQLPPLKIVNQTTRAPAHKVAAQLGAFATLLGYDLPTPTTSLHAGDHFTVTLYYQSKTSTPADDTRFLHFNNPALGMAAQFDSPPQNGVNPTWTWQPGEVIVDPVELTVAAAAKPGIYTLYVGFYEPKANNARVPIHDAAGNTVPDDRMPLTELTIEA